MCFILNCFFHLSFLALLFNQDKSHMTYDSIVATSLIFLTFSISKSKTMCCMALQPLFRVPKNGDVIAASRLTNDKRVTTTLASDVFGTLS